ncbi:MAG: hypothetical protein ACEQSR_05125 [Candidatus Methylacidiphilales bacterium]
MKTIFTFIFTVFLLVGLQAQVKVERENHLRYYTRLVSNNKLILVYSNINYDTLFFDTYNYYGELLNKTYLSNNLTNYYNYFFENNNKIYTQTSAMGGNIYLVEFDENLNYLNKYPLDTAVFKNINSKTFFTPYLNKLYSVVNMNDSNYLIEMDNYGKILNKQNLFIKEKYVHNYDKMEVINGKFVVHFNSKNINYLISTNGQWEKMDELKNIFVSSSRVWNNNVYMACNAYDKYVFAKYNQNGKLIDSFSYPLPIGKRDNSNYLGNYKFIKALGNTFYFSNEYNEKNGLNSSTSAVYLIDFDNKKLNVVRIIEDEPKCTYYGYNAHFNGEATAFSYNKYVTNDSNINKVHYSVIEFAPLPNKCIVKSFPNPSSNQFTASSPMFTEGSLAKLEMYNSEGKLCFEKQLTSNKNQIFIDNNMSNGIYYGLVRLNGKTCTFKQIIQN